MRFYNQKDFQFRAKLSSLFEFEKPEEFEVDFFRREFQRVKIKLRVYLLELILEQNPQSEITLRFLLDDKVVKVLPL